MINKKQLEQEYDKRLFELPRKSFNWTVASILLIYGLLFSSVIWVSIHFIIKYW